jgi:ankyrin repeat protein
LVTCRFLLEHGADVNSIDHWGATPLWSAVTHGTADIVRLLVCYGGKIPEEKGILFDLLYKLSSTPHNEAAWERLLLIPNFDFGIRDYDGSTALHVAASCGEVENVKMLVIAGADPLAKDRWGLDAKVYSRNEGVLYALNHKGSHLDVQNTLGKNRY